MASPRTIIRKLLDTFGLTGVAFRIQERVLAWKALRRETVVAADGLPVPGPALIVSVGGHANAAAFLEGGRIVAETLREILHSQGVPLEGMHAILDFGCGCGRVLRQWHALPRSVAVHGADYNKKAVEWCARHLPFARCAVNDLEPPLAYETGYFDFVYAFSVFTHLSADLQQRWMRELTRITAPGGYILITVHGDGFVPNMTKEERAAYSRGELVVRHSRMAGSNLCAAFHPPAYLRTFAPQLDLVDHFQAKLVQDVVLFRKPRAGECRLSASGTGSRLNHFRVDASLQ